MIFLVQEDSRKPAYYIVDFGCGSGNVLVAAVLRYGMKAYGIEKDEAAYRAACANVKALGPNVAKRICLFHGDFNEERFGSDWLHTIGATHVVVFDKAFNRNTVETLFVTLSEAPRVGGVSSARPNCNVKLPSSFVSFWAD